MTIVLYYVGYHGTSNTDLTSILARINAPLGGRNFTGYAQLGKGFYTTTDYAMAQYFAQNAAVVAGGTPTVLEIFANNFTTMSGFEVARQFWGRVPRWMITEYDYLTAPIEDFEHIRQIKFNPQVYDRLRAHQAR